MDELRVGPDEALSTIENRISHDQVRLLTRDMLAKAGSENHAEYELGISAAQYERMVTYLMLDDLLVRPGAPLGMPEPATWLSNPDKAGLWYGPSIKVPNEATRKYITVTEDVYSGETSPRYYIAFGQEYETGHMTYRQTLGVAAQPGGGVDAVWLGCGIDEDSDVIWKQHTSRKMSTTGISRMSETMRKIFSLPGA